MTTPTFSVNQHTMTYENPKVIIDGFVLSKATIEIDTREMSQTFLQLVMHHMSEGNIRVKLVREQE